MSEPTPERRRGDPEIASLREEVATLTQLTQDMNGEMTGLRGALNDVNDLRRHQIEIEEAARVASTRADTAVEKVDTVVRVAVRRRKELNFVWALVISGVVVTTAFIIAGVVAYSSYQSERHDRQKTSYANCLIRNDSNQSARTLEEAQTKALIRIDPADASTLMTTLQQTEVHQRPVDCKPYLTQ